MTDKTPLDPTEPTTVRIQPPWWTRVAVAVLMVCLGISFVLFSINSVKTVSQRGADLDDLQAQNFQLRDQAAHADALTRMEQECRSIRNANLLNVTSAIAGETAKLFYQLAARAEAETLQPILDNLNSLADQRGRAAKLLDTAVEDCRQPR